jgi:hypothetical protein
VGYFLSSNNGRLKTLLIKSKEFLMPYLNLTTAVLIYVDTNVENPKIRLSDITDTFSQVSVANVKSSETVIAPGETSTVVSTQRTLAAGIATTQFNITRPVETEDITRMEWNGVGSDPLFRGLRATGLDNTSVVSFTRVGPRSMKLMTISGTAFNTTAMITGDQLWIERNTDAYTNPFSAFNCDKLLTIQSKGSNYIVVNDEGLLGEEASVTLGTSYDKAFKVFVQPTSLQPRVNDSVIISNAGFNYYNRGTFQILRITDKYIEFSNPYSTDESAVSGGLIIFDYMIKFAHIIASGELVLTFDGNAQGITIGKLGNTETAQFTSSLQTTQITATNNTLTSISLRCQISGAVEG